MKSFFLILFYLLSCKLLQAQEYTINGNATKDNCHCYTLTTNDFTKSGSVWNNIKIDLSKSFDFVFDIQLGCNDGGADGIVFVLQPISTSVGSTGGGLGFEGIMPSLGVTIDTYQNTDAGSNDPFYDHIAIQLNGNINHQNANANIAGPVTVLDGNNNIEDCLWHTLRIKWDASLKEMNVYVDGVLRLNVVKDLVADVFGANPLVFWGFTGSTGGATNLQQFCTALNPAYRLLPNQKRCINEPITFYDSIVAFAPVAKVYWNFGDNSPIDSVNKNPTHTYNIAGDYTILQTVVGADGCVEVNTQSIKIGSYPVANFSTMDGCPNKELQLSDQSSVGVGTINNWTWILGNGDTAIVQNPIAIYTTAGSKTITLTVKTLEGCESTPVSISLEVFPLPVTNFNVTGKFCKKSILQFTNLTTISSGSVVTSNFVFGNGQQSNLLNPSMQFDSSKNYNVMLTANSDKGCSKTTLKSVFILPSPIALFNHTISCTPLAVNFKDSSKDAANGSINNWWWQLGNGNSSSLQNPTANYVVTGNVNIQMVVTSTTGCQSDTLNKIIFIPSRPQANFNNSNPLCIGKPITFTDASSITNGSIKIWEWYVDGQLLSLVQSPIFTFAAGKHSVQLIVKNEAGCSSDTVTKIIFIHSLPVVSMQFSNACKNELVQFTGIDFSGGNIETWLWDFGDSFTGSNKAPTHIYTAIGTYKIQLNVKSVAGCKNVIDSNISIFGTSAFAGNDTIVATNQPVQLQATGGIFYQWSPATGLNNSTIANPIATIKSNQRFTVTASTPEGCKSSSSVQLKVYNGPTFYVPTSFTPNGDYLNDVLKVLPVGMLQFKYFTIYNRQGEIVFSTGNANNGWNGLYKGKMQSTGVYVWIASGKTYKGVDLVSKGSVVLLR